MKQAVIATEDQHKFSDIVQALAANQFEIAWAGSGREAVDLIKQKKAVDLFIADTGLGDMETKALVEKAIMTNPMVNCIPVSSLAHKEFHDYFEGLGVLMPLPLAPGPQDARDVIACIKKIFSLTNG